MGYGGWSGLMIAPILMTATESRPVRWVIFFLSPPVCALLMTAIVTAMYGFGYLMILTFSTMIHPQFLHILCNSFALMISAISASTVLRYNHIKTLNAKASETETETENASVSSDQTPRDVSSTDISEVEETENSQTSDEENEVQVDNSWREKANFEGLRNAPPLPDEEENQTS